MSYVPEDTKWYLADLVQEIRIAGVRGNAVHINTYVVRADSPNEAFEKALVIGRRSKTTYLNPSGKRVAIVFRGIHQLQAVYEPLRHGSEISYQEIRNVSESALKKLIRSKADLDIFVPPTPRRQRDFDYASAEAIEQAEALMNSPRFRRRKKK